MTANTVSWISLAQHEKGPLAKTATERRAQGFLHTPKGVRVCRHRSCCNVFGPLTSTRPAETTWAGNMCTTQGVVLCGVALTWDVDGKRGITDGQDATRCDSTPEPAVSC